MARTAMTMMMVIVLLGGCRGGEREPAHTPIEKSTIAGGATLRLRVDRSEAAVGEAIHLDMSVDGGGDRPIEWPALDETLTAFHVKRTLITDRALGTTRQSWVLRPLEAGDVQLPAIEVKLGPAASATTQPAGPDAAVPDATTPPADVIVLRSEPLTLQIAAVAPADANPTSAPALIDDPRNLPIDRRLVYAIAAGSIIFAIVILALLVRWIRRRQQRPAAPPPPIPADEWALAALRKLRERGLVRAGRVKEFYFELNMIVRQYIERRFGLRAPEMTTEEFLDSLRSSSRLSGDHQRALMPFMEACDLVKYARHEPTTGEIEDVDRTAESFVLKTAHAPSGAHEELEAALEEAVP